MKKTISYLILSFFTLQLFTASAQNLYIGSFYVTTNNEEKLYGDGGDMWANRRPVICDMFKFEQPDVLGLQSLTASQLSAIKSGISYNAAGDILYNKNTIQLLDNGAVEDLPEGTTCTWAKLQKEEKAFYVFNICFSAETATTAAMSIQTATGEINAENLPCFVVGYLGVNETHAAYSRMTSKFNDCYTKASVVSAEFGTVNNFDLEANHGTERFDFIFTSKLGVTAKAYGQLQYGYYTKESDGKYKRRLLSTHFPIMAKVTL